MPFHRLVKNTCYSLCTAYFGLVLGGCQGDSNPVIYVTIDGMWDDIKSLAFTGALKDFPPLMIEQQDAPPGKTTVLALVTLQDDQFKLQPGERTMANLAIDGQGNDGCILATATGQVEVMRGQSSNLKVQLVRESQKLCRVTVHTAGVGIGLIVSDPVPGAKGINCSSRTDCIARIPAGQALVLRAQGGANSHFGGWSDDCTGRSTVCSLPPLVGPVEVTAQFDMGVCTSSRFCWESPLPQGNSLRSVAGIPGKSIAWAVGDSGTILHREGGGWVGRFAGSETAPIANNLLAVSGSSESDIWAVGEAGTILHWDGKNWQVSPQSGTVTTTDLYGVSALETKQAFAVGDQTMPVALNWDGIQWTPRAPNDPVLKRPLRRVLAFQPGQATAVGGAGVVSQFNGVWTPSSYASMGPLQDLLGLWGTNPQELWAVGNNSIILRYDGAQWQQQNRANLGTGGLTGVWGTDRQNVWAVGNGAMIAHTTDGTNWEPFPQQGYGSVAFNDIWGGAANDILIVGDNGWILRGQGSTFVPDAATFVRDTDQPVDIAPRQAIFATAGVNSQSIWAVGQGGLILRWNGQRWQREDNPDPQGRELYGIAVSSSDVWAVGNAGVVLRRSLSSSAGWTLIELPRPDRLNAVAATANSVVAVGNAGALWRYPLALGKWADQSFRSEDLLAAFARGQQVWIGGKAGVNGRTIFEAEDQTLMTWTPQILPTTATIRALWGGQDSRTWAAGDGVILTLSGGNWSPSYVNPATTLVAGWGDGQMGWAVGSAGIVLQLQAGKWNSVPSGTNNDLKGIWGSDPTDFVTVGDNGTILRYNPPAK